MRLYEEIFQNWENFWHSRKIRIATPGTKSEKIKSSGAPQKTKD